MAVDAEISWYLYLTKTFITAFLGTLPVDRHVSVKSEDLFAQETHAFENLKSVVPIDDIPEAEYQSNYARKINEKTEFVDESFNDIDQRMDDVRGFLKQLEKSGELPIRAGKDG